MSKTSLVILCCILGLSTIFFGYHYARKNSILQELESCKNQISLLKGSAELKVAEQKRAPELKQTVNCTVARGFATAYNQQIANPARNTEPAGFVIPNAELADLIAAQNPGTPLNPTGSTILVLGKENSVNCIILFPMDPDLTAPEQRRLASYSHTRETFPPLTRRVAQVNYNALFNCEGVSGKPISDDKASNP